MLNILYYNDFPLKVVFVLIEYFFVCHNAHFLSYSCLSVFLFEKLFF